MGFELLQLYTGSPIAQALSRWAAVGFFAVSVTRLGLRERALLGVCLGVSATLMLRGEPDAILRALDQGAFLAAFIQIMGLLREAAVQSPAIRKVGAYLTQQPPKRRGLAVLGGGHAFGVLLSFGAISLLAPLIQSGVRASSSDPEIAAIREQRQLSALLRGFSWIVVWAPTTVTQALLADSLPGLDGAMLLVLGLATAILMLGLGWAEDYAAWRATGARLRASGRVAQGVPRLPRRAMRNLAGVFATLIGMAVAIRWLAGVPTVPAMMLTAPICLVLWTVLQNGALGATGALRKTGRALSDIAAGPIPNGARESATLGASGFIGVAAAALAPSEAIASWVTAIDPDPALLLIALPLLIVLAGQIALSPIMMVVFIASVLSAFPIPPVDETLIGLALSCGWAITMTASPNVAGALVLARATGRSAYELTWRWNLRYSLLAFIALAAILYVLTRLW